ncbi:hypothetical protein EI42_05409 [Thermosporothrix hazakensis]|uniref:Uncharacterized protein n=1 Tax=Thermosporothrix hazakensis TaxID=644383 RepID=A0A326U246_THEHA|nr:hypothetical protein [Thermosporothrix hazakensis]PZW22503.1 hypothetical protein EI42_05409 [Thermosporothrix hazakensis]
MESESTIYRCGVKGDLPGWSVAGLFPFDSSRYRRALVQAHV